MKSIKPGRGPSFMGGISSVVAVVFGLIWTIAAGSMDAPPFFLLFGVLFMVLGAAQAIYNFKNAAGKNRYSAFDITDAHEEPDPLNRKFGPEASAEKVSDGQEGGSFCPYCGQPAGQDHSFCRSCGRELK
jgi:hypothetical protein